MAGPSILVRVLGDTKGLSSAFQETGKQAEGASKRIRGAFTSVLGTLNRTGVLGPFGESVAQIDESIQRVTEHAKGIGTAMLGVGGTLAGVGVGLAALGSKDQAAHQQLQAAVEATGKDYEDYKEQVEKAVKSQEKFGHTANETQDALRILTQATGDPAKALQFLSTASDLAAAKHEGLTEAAGQLGKAYNGAGRILKEFGVTAAPKAATAERALESATRGVDSAVEGSRRAHQRLADLMAIFRGKTHLTVAEQIRLRDAQQNVQAADDKLRAAHNKLTGAQKDSAAAAHGQTDTMAALADKLKGQASASADTFTGKLDALKAKVEDAAAAFGQKYGPVITAAGAGMTLLGGVVSATGGILKSFKATQEAATAATEAATVAAEAETVALEGEAVAAETAEAASLPLIATVGLIVLAIAALGVAAYAIYRNWSTIWGGMKAAAKAVWDWIKNNWPYLTGFLLGPIGLAAAAIYKNWDTIWSGLKTVFNWIKNNWPLLLAILTGPIGLAVLAIDKFWKQIVNGIITGINFVIRLWNDLHFKTPSIGFGPFHTPSITIGMPHIPEIPHLAQGGMITQSGLVFAHAGEAITPIEKIRTGPVVAIDNAHFNSEVDVEAFMRRVAWTVQTQAI